METMLNVTVNGTIHQYPYGTTYRAIAAEFQENYPCLLYTSPSPRD